MNLTHNLSPVASQGALSPVHVQGTDVYEFRFSGSADSLNSHYVLDTTVKNNALDFTDHFSTSVWIKANDNSRLNQYLFSFDNDNVGNNGGKRVFTWRLRGSNSQASRMTFFYTRARLDNINAGQTDLGENQRVGLSFYFHSAVIPSGSIFDGKWHFYKLDIDYPSIKLYVDGYMHVATEGHYFDVADVRRTPPQLGTINSMPARLSTKSNTLKSQIVGRIGNSFRYPEYGFNGFLRLLIMSSTLTNEQYTCIASCNNSLVPEGYSPGVDNFNRTIGNFTNVFYQPVSRTLYFTYANGPPSQYTSFIHSISYYTNGHLPVQTVANTGEGRRIELKVSNIFSIMYLGFESTKFKLNLIHSNMIVINLHK